MRAGARLALLVAAAAGFACGADEPPAEAEPTAAIETAAVTEGPIEERVEALGVVELDPGRVRAVPFPHDGEVARVLVVEGQSVLAGDVLVELGPASRKGLAARQARIELEFAERELARVRRMAADGLAGNAERESAEKAAASARAALAALGGGDGAPAEPLRAPEAGVVVDAPVSRGAWVAAGQLAVSVAPSDALVVRVGFEPERAEQLVPTAEMEIAPVFAAEASAPLRARAEVQRRVDAATQLVEVRIPISVPPAWLVAGARVRVRGVTVAREHATLVPTGALLHHGAQAGVFVVADGRARWRDVTVGARADGIIEVTAGVTSGERVATAGRSSLEDEMPVRVSSPAGAP